MIGYRLSRTGTAKNSFYVSSIGIHLTSVEELLFFLEKNAPLIDDTIVGPKLTRWLNTEFGLTELALRMERALKDENNIMEFVLPLFTETGWLSGAEFRSYSQLLVRLHSESEGMRLKMRGECLAGNRKYGSAIKVLHEAEEATDRGQKKLLSEICRCAGKAAMQLLEYDEAVSEFSRALTYNSTRENLKNYLIAFRLAKPEDLYLDECDDRGIDDELFYEVEDTIDAAFGGDIEVPEDPSVIMDELRNRYHRES